MHVEAGFGVKNENVEKKWREEKVEVEEVEDDWRNVEQLSDMFSLMEGEHELGADFGVFIEDEDAINVEEISDIFSALEEANQSSKELGIVLNEVQVKTSDVEDARAVEEFSDLFSELEGAEDAAAAVDVEDAQNVDEMADLFTDLEEQDAVDASDAKNVDAMSELFSELEDGQDDKVTDQDWIDALQVDSVSNLFSELEKAAETEPAPVPLVSLPKPAVPKVDSRIFVPKFSVQIEGRSAPCLGPSLLSKSPALLSGPPRSVSRHCPPPPAALLVETAMQTKGKRKARSAPDPSISDTRRACAAKRHRVKGRFVTEKQSFVPITSLQQF